MGNGRGGRAIVECFRDEVHLGATKPRPGIDSNVFRTLNDWRNPVPHGHREGATNREIGLIGHSESILRYPDRENCTGGQALGLGYQNCRAIVASNRSGIPHDGVTLICWRVYLHIGGTI